MITQAELKEALHYNPDTGIFTRLITISSRAKAGTVAGYFRSDGYIYIGINKKQYLAHRLAWLYMYGEFPVYQLDHMNHKRADNRIMNLRTASNQENHKNRSKSARNTSGMTGVGWYKATGKWRSEINVDSRKIHLGYFEDKFEAICARLSANNKYGFHPNHGAACQK